MSESEIQTEHLTLLLQTPQQVLAAIEAMTQSEKADVSPAWLEMVRGSSVGNPWLHGFVLVHRASGTMIGSCGYKGPPGREAVVEIAYGLDPSYQGRGYATEAARALVAFAFGSGRVRVVRAHTRPAKNASTRVLTKCGFKWVGEVMDPEDGLVWRWELQQEAPG